LLYYRRQSANPDGRQSGLGVFGRLLASIRTAWAALFSGGWAIDFFLKNGNS
jgi:hypothetical protein